MLEKNDVKKLAKLARITISAEEEKALEADLAAILEYVEDVKRAGVSHTEPSVGDVYNVTRPDENPHESGLYTDALLSAAPSREDNYIKVKKILA